MTAFHIQANACTGRGFSGTDANGFLKNLKDWIVKAPNDPDPTQRGAGWTILDDQSALATNPYIVASDQVSPTPNSRARIIQFILPTATAQQIQANCWFYWNSSTHVGTGKWAVYNVPTVDSGVFGYDFRGGPDFMWLASFISGSLVWGCLESFDNISTFLDDPTVIGTLQAPLFNATGDSGNILSGYNLISGITYTSGNTDASFNLYFNLNFSAGNYVLNAYKDSAKTQLVAHIASFNTIGTKSWVVDNSSGIGGSITINSLPGSSVTTISCQFLTVRLVGGQGSLFAVGKKYFMFDATSGTTFVSYFQVAAISGDVLTLTTTFATAVGSTNTKVFTTGSLFGAYPHRFCVICLRNWVATSNNSPSGFAPYAAAFGLEYQDVVGAAFVHGIDTGLFENWAFAMSVDVAGNFYTSKFGVLNKWDNQQTAIAGILLGLTRNLMVTTSFGLSVYSFGRVDSGENFMDVYHMSNFMNVALQANTPVTLAFMVRDTAHTT